MLKRSRVSGVLDVTRLSAAVSRPGIDPRVWVTIAYALADSVIAADGVFVDVITSDGSELTCQLGATYEGPGFGFYSKVKKDDELVVLIPEGHPNSGGVVICRLWSRADPPPAEAQAHPEDVVLRMADGANLQIVTDNTQVTISTQGGKVLVDPGEAAGGVVFLGGDNLETVPGPLQDGVVTGKGIDTFTGQTYATLLNSSAVVFAKK